MLRGSPPRPLLSRISVVGDAGAGKTSLASALAARLGLPHTELDALVWGPGWQETPTGLLRERVEAIAASERWVMDGNYRSRLSDLLWPRATTIVWLDLPLRVTIPRLIRRTARRLLDQEPLWNENRERWRQLLSPDHPIWYTLRTDKQRRRHYSQLADSRWVRLQSVDETRRWLDSLTE